MCGNKILCTVAMLAALIMKRMLHNIYRNFLPCISTPNSALLPATDHYKMPSKRTMHNSGGSHVIISHSTKKNTI
jgi:hypothetical protein